MSDLQTKQSIFTRFLAELIDEFTYETITMGEAWRSPETCELYAKQGKGILHSCHTLRLAVDLNLFKDGKLSNRKEDYEPLGKYWKELPEHFPSDIKVVTRWGGDFTSLCDFYHFSIEHNGVQ